MSVYARDSKCEGMKDVLIIDNYLKKRALLDLHRQTAAYHEWDEVLDMSIPIDNDIDLKPGWRKKLLRKIKVLPVVRFFYDRLLKRAQNDYAERYAEILRDKLDAFIQQNVSLNLLTQTALNEPLIHLFPNATISYFEHGQGDYFYVLKDKLGQGNFYCVFAKQLRTFLSTQKIPADFVHSFIDTATFEKAVLFAGRYCKDQVENIASTPKRIVIFLMDSCEIYHPPENFWSDYLTRCLQEINHPEEFLWVVKPHPNQSNGVIQKTKIIFQESGLDFIFLDDPMFVSLSAEYLFINLKEKTEAVFTTFSSAIFYLSHFYPGQSKYYVLYDFVGKYFSNAPKQYLEIYKGLNKFYTGMFSDFPLKRIR
jgi:hypothetical protein